jgi:hypothetical protein
MLWRISQTLITPSARSLNVDALFHGQKKRNVRDLFVKANRPLLQVCS